MIGIEEAAFVNSRIRARGTEIGKSVSMGLPLEREVPAVLRWKPEEVRQCWFLGQSAVSW